MPELPEVETVRRSISPHLLQKKIRQVIVRHPKLRWPIPVNLPALLNRQTITAITRRGKYLSLQLSQGYLIIHLGMSGRLYVCSKLKPIAKHDHVDIVLANDICLRFTDPRRFGAILWSENDPSTTHPLLMELGVEPLTPAFNGTYLFSKTANRSVPIKNLIMDSHIVVGVGNIYAAEALFLARIHPLQTAGSLSLSQLNDLAKAIKQVLRAAIKQGGTTLKDFVSGNSEPGYFRQFLRVYGRHGENCLSCQTVLSELRLNQRSTVFCSNCQMQNKPKKIA